MTTSTKIAIVALVFAVISIGFTIKQAFPIQAQALGSLGVKLAENYDPYLRYNGGYYSALPIQTTGTFAASGTTTLSDTVNFYNPAICMNFYATSTATVLHFVASTTGTLPNGAAAVITAAYGACSN